jgi:hypothetical protein
MTEESRSSIGVGMPQWMKLNLFGQLLREAFPGTIPYLVGTAATSKEWRDVDVRVMLDGEEWERFVGEGWEMKTRDGAGRESPAYEAAHMEQMTNARPTGRRRTALQLAFSALGQEMTGLPIDFQFQWQDEANDVYGSERRVPLGGIVGDRSG